MSKNHAVIIDNGSGLMKAGFGNDDTPTVVFPTLVGVPKNPSMMVGMDQKELYVGQEAYEKKPLLFTSEPIQHGIIKDMKAMETIWTHIYENELSAKATDHPVLLAEPPLNPKKIREELLEKFLEEIGCSAFYMVNTAVLALFSSGRTTGIIIDSGHGVTHTVPIYEGFALPHAINRIELGGKDLTLFMRDLLKDQGYSYFGSSESIDVAEKIKEKKCFVALDFDAESKKSMEAAFKDVTYMLPDSNTISMKSEPFRCPEALFHASKMGTLKEYQGIHELTYKSILLCDPDIRTELYKTITIAGGSTMFRDLGLRLRREIGALAPSTMDVKVREKHERKYSAWIGGSILSSISSFEHIWITKKDFDEDGGVSIVHRKCFN